LTTWLNTLYYKGEDEINQNKKTVVEKKLKKGLTKRSNFEIIWVEVKK